MKTTISFVGGGSIEVEGALEETRDALVTSDGWGKVTGPEGDLYVRLDAVSHIGPEREEYRSAQFA